MRRAKRRHHRMFQRLESLRGIPARGDLVIDLYHSDRVHTSVLLDMERRFGIAGFWEADREHIWRPIWAACWRAS